MDSRWYFGQFQPALSEVSGLRRAAILATKAKFAEGRELRERSGILVFAGTRDYFRSLNGRNSLVKLELEKAVQPRWNAVVSSTTVSPIGIHVRRGDFVQVDDEGEFKRRGGVRTPMNWYIRALEYIRSRVGPETGAFVVSDGRIEELAELLAVPRVKLLRTGSAIGDLLLLARARVLIASGGSSFSAWSSYLGEIPTISVPGHSLTWFGLQHLNGAYVGEYGDGQPSESFEHNLNVLATELAQIKRR